MSAGNTFVVNNTSTSYSLKDGNLVYNNTELVFIPTSKTVNECIINNCTAIYGKFN